METIVDKLVKLYRKLGGEDEIPANATIADIVEKLNTVMGDDTEPTVETPSEPSEPVSGEG